MTSPISSPRECKLLLCVDTSGPEGSLALWSPEKLHHVEWVKKSAHSEVITLELQKLFAQSGHAFRDLTHIAVNVGPGSFTGLRIGISLAKALAYSLNIEVLAVNSLELLASLTPGEGEVFIATKAIQKWYYAATFKKSADAIEVLRAPFASETLPAGENVWAEGQRGDFRFTTKAEDLARFVQKFALKRTFSPWKNVEPLYVRGSEAEEKLKAGLLKPL